MPTRSASRAKVRCQAARAKRQRTRPANAFDGLSGCRSSLLPPRLASFRVWRRAPQIDPKGPIDVDARRSPCRARCSRVCRTRISIGSSAPPPTSGSTAGEYAVHEGGERALYAVLSGKFEVVKRFDGVERTLGWRLPGTIFGEVPLAFATPFPGAYRAAEPSRVMRVEPHHYFADRLVGARGGREGRRAGARAHRRAAGHRDAAAEGADHRLRRTLGPGLRRPAPLPVAQPDRPRLAVAGDPGPRLARGPATCPRRRSARSCDCPTARSCSKPTLRELAVRLDLQTRPREDVYDTVIIGGGPAGLAAAVYGASEGLRTLVIEREAPGGQAGTSSRIENYLGFPNGVSGDELASRALQQARRLGAEILVTRSVERMDPAIARGGSRRRRARARAERHRRHRRVVATPGRSTASTDSSARASTTAPHAAKPRRRTGRTCS